MINNQALKMFLSAKMPKTHSLVQGRSGGLALGGALFLCIPLTVDVNPPYKTRIRKTIKA